MDDYEALGLELAEPEPLDGGAVLQSMQAESPDLLAGGLPFSRCTQAVKQAVDAGKMTADFVIVTRASEPNRHGNMVQIAESKYGKGLRLDEYQHNPVVLLDHAGLPIGTSAADGKLSVKLQKTKATATVYFSQQSQVAEDVFRLVDEGVLRMASIGFMPTRAMLVKQRKEDSMPEGVENLQRYRGYDFVEAMLWEWSITAIGADAGALRQCLDCGEVAGRKFHPVLRPMMQRYAEQRPAWSPGFGDGKLNFVDATPSGEPVTYFPMGSFESAMQRIGDHLTEQITQAVDRRLAAPQTPAAEASEPEQQAACTCQQKKRVDTPVQPGTTPAAQSALAPVATPQQIAQAMQQPAAEANPLADLIRQTVIETVTPAVASFAAEQQRMADRIEQMTGKIPV